MSRKSTSRWDAPDGATISTNAALDRALDLLKQIQGALGTEETGANLVEVARDAHRAEQELAALTLKREREDA